MSDLVSHPSPSAVGPPSSEAVTPGTEEEDGKRGKADGRAKWQQANGRADSGGAGLEVFAPRTPRSPRYLNDFEFFACLERNRLSRNLLCSIRPRYDPCSDLRLPSFIFSLAAGVYL